MQSDMRSKPDEHLHGLSDMEQINGSVCKPEEQCRIHHEWRT